MSHISFDEVANLNCTMLKFYELTPSPNNMKVRMALKYKGIEFEQILVDYFDRQSLLEASGQDGSPIIQDKGIVLNDSEAIMIYLDANYPDTPRLMPRDLKSRYACDKWKRMTDDKIAAPWFRVWRYAIKRTDILDESAISAYVEGLHWLNDEIGDRDTFHDNPEMAICDLRAALWAVYALPSDALLARVGLLKSSKRIFDLDEKDFPNLMRFLGPWDDRLK